MLLSLSTVSSSIAATKITTEVLPQSGTDTTYEDTTESFVHSIDVRPLQYSDDDKLTSGSFWPLNYYRNSRYLEVNFFNSSGENAIPANSKVKRVNLVMEYTSLNAPLKKAHIKVFDGKNWSKKKKVRLPEVGSDRIQTINITKAVKSAYRANNLSIRFQAYSLAPTQTAIDQIKEVITYVPR